ncbi:S41 family peptidase [Gorillibacterium sp. sgz5001074]|uniref:S41 family peptidase n=1 Tax=Gorillibacterium sp. sgz5001074 TaxID=3446695 RepID=UPI003F66F83B
MVFRGRTVLAFLLLGMFASSILTLTIVEPSGSGMEQVKAVAAPTAAPAEGLSQADLNKLSTTYSLIKSKYVSAVDHDKLLNGAIHGMVEALDDPFTSYMDPKEAKQFEETISASFQGIGAEVSLEDGRVTIVSPMKESPAEKAGIRANDVILSVNGEKLEGLTLTQAVMKIRGPKGTQAKLSIMRSGTTEPVEVIVVRDDIPVETVIGEMITPTVGKLEIRQFSSNTAVRFKEELNRLESKGMKALVIDVRNNPGGLLPVVVEIAENFVAKGKPIVQIEDRDGKRVPTNSEAASAPKHLPVAVLINKGSASASEILAGVFKDTGLGKLVGETTFGKGTVQVTFEKEMGDGSNIKLTTYKWLTPNGTWIHKKGIDPDVKVEQPAYYQVMPFSKKTVLKPDMNHDDVKSLQLILEGLGYKPDRTDGYFSEKTAAVLKEYQRANGLPVSGEADNAVMDKLEKDIVVKLRDPKSDLQLNEALKVLGAQP